MNVVAINFVFTQRFLAFGGRVIITPVTLPPSKSLFDLRFYILESQVDLPDSPRKKDVARAAF